MAVSYSAYTTVATTSWDTTLLDGQWAFSGYIDNTSNLYEDFIIQGHIALGTGWAAGEGIAFYVASNINTSVTTDVAGAIGTTGLITPDSEEVDGTDFLAGNLAPMGYAAAEKASDTIHLPYMSVASALGGFPPPKFMVAIHLLASGTDPLAAAAGTELGYVGVKTT